MNLVNLINTKSFYRITGTPENFLTALRYKVWGFNAENKDSWLNVNQGDIIFFHSKISDSYFIKKGKSCIIGFGVVGNYFYEDNTRLWIDEYKENKSYPYRFTFSEIYMFSDIPIDDSWDSTSLKKKENTISIIELLLKNSISLSSLDFGKGNRFPHMASYSEVLSTIVKKEIITGFRDIIFYEGIPDEEIVSKSTKLEEFGNTTEQLRYATSLLMFEDIKKKIFNKKTYYQKHNIEKLSLAELAHYNIVSYLRDFFDKKGYTVYKNNHVDMFAIKNNSSYLIEAKSIDNLNFKRQSRKAIVQLFEYNYFEINSFKQKNNLQIFNETNLLVTSKLPEDIEYIKFINSFNIKTAAVTNNKILTYGDSININTI